MISAILLAQGLLWIGTISSFVFWLVFGAFLVFGFCLIFIVNTSPEERGGQIIGGIFIFLLSSIVLYDKIYPEEKVDKSTHPKPVKGSPEYLKDELYKKIKEMETKKAAYDQTLGSVEKEKAETIESLKKIGIQKPSDLKDNPKAQRMAENLAQLSQELRFDKKKLSEYEELIVMAKFKLRGFERLLILRSAGITDEELKEITNIIASLDQKLKSSLDNPVPLPLQVESILEKELNPDSK